LSGLPASAGGQGRSPSSGAVEYRKKLGVGQIGDGGSGNFVTFESSPRGKGQAYKGTFLPLKRLERIGKDHLKGGAKGVKLAGMVPEHSTVFPIQKKKRLASAVTGGLSKEKNSCAIGKETLCSDTDLVRNSRVWIRKTQGYVTSSGEEADH